MKFCTVRGCRSECFGGCSISFHAFPKDEVLRKKWLKAVGKSKASKSTRICHKHFDEDCFVYDSSQRRKLKPNVVPTKFKNIEPPPKSIHNKLKNMVANSSERRLPKDPIQRENWAQFLGIPTNELRVSLDHVSKIDFIQDEQENNRSPVSLVEKVDSNTYKVCRLCLTLNVKMYHLKNYNLTKLYEDVIGISVANENNNVLMAVCWECVGRLQSAAKFKSKARVCNVLLQDYVKTNPELKIKDILSIHNTHSFLKSSLIVQEIHNFQIENLYENGAVKTEVSGVPISKHNESEVDKLIIDKLSVKVEDESNNKTDDENFFHTSTIDIDLVPTETDTSSNVKNDRFSDIGNISMDTDNLDNIIIVVSEDQNVDDKVTNNLLKHVNNDLFDAIKIDGNRSKKKREVGQKIICQKEDNSNILLVRSEKKPYIRKSLPIDDTVFITHPLSLEQVKQEILDRKLSAKYLKAAYKCNICYKGFPAKDKWTKHMLNHSKKSGPVTCKICKIRMKSTKRIREHMRQQHTNEYVCKLCPLVTRNKGVALEHMRYHAGSKFKCPHCSIEFEKKTTYQNHLRRKHMSDKVCELCGYTFVSDYGLLLHKRLTHKFADPKAQLTGPHCEVCDVKFHNKKAYEKHLRLSSKHLTEDDPKRLSNDPNVKRSFIRGRPSDAYRSTHISRERSRTLASTRPLTCEQCGVVVQSLRTYTSHFNYSHPGIERTQSGVSHVILPYICEHCGKMFANRSTLVCHMWVHTGEKRFQCDHCNKSFTTKNNLVGHIKYQHGTVRPSFDCAVCGKGFGNKYNLNRHMFQHTGFRPFKCDGCEKTFKTLGEKRLHTDHVHLKKPWPKRIRQRVKKCDTNHLEY